MTDTILIDEKIEHVLLGRLLVVPTTIRAAAGDAGLTPEHFAAAGTGIAYEAIVQIADQGDTPNEPALVAALEADPRMGPNAQDRRYAAQALVTDLLTAGYGLYDGANVPDLAERLKDLHRRRQVQHAARLLHISAEQNDDDLRFEAERLLTRPDGKEQTSWDAAELKSWYFDQLNNGKVKAFPYEFAKMNDWTGGGIRVGSYVLLGGWSSHGKSVLLDCMLEHWANQGLRTHLYINEQTRGARLDRTVARISGVPFKRVRTRELRDGEDKKIVDALDRLKVGITDCAGWTAEEIARHIRWNKWDIAGVDILHNIAHDDERSMAEISGVMRATSLQTGTALICTVHLNDARAVGAQHPVPVPRDIRMSGMLYRQCDDCFFVHRDEDTDGLPTNTGILLASKIRDGEPSLMKVMFDGARMRFTPAGLSVVRGDQYDPDTRTQSEPAEVAF